MYINVKVKNLGSKRDKFKYEKYYLESKPQTIRELIIETVKTCVKAYNKRITENRENVISEEELQCMSEFGKIAFGFNYNGKPADEHKAIETALLAYEDGLFRILINEAVLEDKLDKDIAVNENDELIFIRLTMLTGSML